MPILADREQREQELAAALIALYARLRVDIAAGDADYFSFAAQFAAIIRESLADTFVAAGTALAGGMEKGGDFQAASASERATAYASGVGTVLAMKVAQDIRFGAAVGMNVAASDADKQRIAAELFTDNRAVNIAITETTRAISAGESNAAALVAVLTRTLATWFWEIEDGDACSVCQDLNGLEKPSVEPPAHPSCRCRKRYQFLPVGLAGVV